MISMIAATGPGIARIIMGLFYWAMAIGLIKDFKMVAGLMAAKGVPAQVPLLALAIVIWIVGGGFLVAGRAIVPAALVLFVLTLAVTLVIHNFWAAPPEMATNEIQHFLKNVAILAGLISIAASAATTMPS